MAGNAGSDQNAKQEQKRLGPTIAAGASRVSKVVGGVGSRVVREEQRANTPAPAVKRASRGAASASTRRGQGGGGSWGSGGRSGKNQGASPYREAPLPAPQSPSPAGGTADSRAISRARNAWSNLEPHHQQRLLSILLLALSLFLLAGLTVFRKTPIFSAFNTAFTAFFGWSAYLLAIGLAVFAVAHLIEGIRNQHTMRSSFIIGLVLLWLIVLAESQLLLGGSTGGAVGYMLTIPLTHWGWPGIGHIILIGLFGLVTIVTFRLTLGHFIFAGQTIGNLFSSGGNKAANNKKPMPSQFLGQRPQFSRYGQGVAAPTPTPAPAPPSPGKRRGAVVSNAEEDDESLIEFEADFGEEDDPRNDINLHKQQISRVPRGPLPALPLNADADAHKNAAQGASQQPLPFNQASKGSMPNTKYPTLEPLAPNPLMRKNQQKVISRAAGAAKPVNESPWNMPDTTLLNHPEEVKLHMLGDDTATLARTIQDTLRSFRVEAEVKAEDISVGPTVIRFGIRPTGKPELKQDKDGKFVPVRDAGGNIVYEQRTRVSRIMALQNDLALVLEAKSIRMEAPVPGRPFVGVEIPNKNSRLVTLREVLESKEYQTARAKSKLAIVLGKDVAGQVRVGDLTRMPHLLIAGATGAGKSVCLNTIIASILTQATPDDVRLLLVDPKMVELNMYTGIPHLLLPVVTEVEKVVPLLRNAITEMERRYRLFSQLGVRNLDSYRKLRTERLAHNDSSLKNLPAIVIIIDELADLMIVAPEEVEGMICRLAQLARATGIHLVIATQRPSVDVITGLIKANIPTRISFMVSSAVDSRTIIDMGGAERLLGRGDMLYLPADAGRPERIQGAFLADEEAERLIAYWRQQALNHAQAANSGAKPDVAVLTQAVEPGWEVKDHPSDEFELDDELLEKAEEVVREYERASISLLQRRLRIGYSRAARLIDLLEERGIIGRSESGGRSREVLEGGGRSNGNGNGGGEGRTMADEVSDIIAEEKAREEFLKKQGLNGNKDQN